MAPCKLSLGQGQGRVQPDLGSCNFPQPPAPAELTALSPYFINIPKGVPSPARPAAPQSLCPLQTAFTMSGEPLGGAGPGLPEPSRLRIYTRIYRDGTRQGGGARTPSRGGDPASDGRRQLPLGALAASVQDKVCAGPRGHRGLWLRGLGRWWLPCGGKRGRVRGPAPSSRPRPRQPRPQAAAGSHRAGSPGSAGRAAPDGGAAAENGRCCADRCPG